jgi:hypothetical protein
LIRGGCRKYSTVVRFKIQPYHKLINNDMNESSLRIPLKKLERDNPHDFYFNHAFLPKTDYEGYRNNAKKEFEENQNDIVEEIHKEPDHPITFLKMFTGQGKNTDNVSDK